MTGTITVRLPKEIRAELKAASREDRVPVSDLVRESLKRFLSIRKFRKLRSIALPFAEAQGLLTDEDIFRALK